MILKDVCPELCASKNIGTSVPDGWSGIVMEFVVKLRELLSEDLAEGEKSAFQVLQLKEKFGTIRLYYGFTSEEEGVEEKVKSLVNNLELESGSVCLDCGSRDEVEQTNTGWIATLCKKCREKRED